jgi:hypothetical protein
MHSRWIRRACATALFGVMIVSASPAGALIESFRDLRPVHFNPDGTMDCAKWCGLLESCC